MNRAETGRKGEAAAAKFYLKQGCKLLAHNFRTRMGELDVVVQEPDGTIVICEVKTRAENALASPAEAVDRPKQRRLIRAAQVYLQTTGPVSYTHLSTSYGTCLRVLHADDSAALYAHLQYAYARPGEVVKAGQLLGTAGQSGRATGAHLHFELRRQGTPCDPAGLLGIPDAVD